MMRGPSQQQPAEQCLPCVIPSCDSDTENPDESAENPGAAFKDSFDPVKSSIDNDTPVHKEHQRKKLYDTLINHAFRCVNSQCKFPNCARMKSCIQHGNNCKVRILPLSLSGHPNTCLTFLSPFVKIKASGGCEACKGIWSLIRIHHAEQCENPDCRIPQCIVIKIRLRQLQLPGQAQG